MVIDRVVPIWSHVMSNPQLIVAIPVHKAYMSSYNVSYQLKSVNTVVIDYVYLNYQHNNRV